MSECLTGVGGNGFVQYGKDDCTFTDEKPAQYINSRMYFPSGITFKDILLMRAHQYNSSYGDPNSWLFKRDDTTITGSSEFNVNPSATYFELPMSQSAGTAASMLEVIIVVKK